MTSARSMVVSFVASVAALAALAHGAQAASPSSASRSTIVAFASNLGFQNTTALNFGDYSGSNAATAAPFAGALQTADIAGAQSESLRIAALSRNTSKDRFANQGILPALSAGLALRRGRRGVDIGEF